MRFRERDRELATHCTANILALHWRQRDQPVFNPEKVASAIRSRVNVGRVSSLSERAAFSPGREPGVANPTSRRSPRMRATDLMVKICRPHTRAPYFRRRNPRLTPGALRCRSLRELFSGLCPHANGRSRSTRGRQKLRFPSRLCRLLERVRDPDQNMLGVRAAEERNSDR